ncbi:M48 family metallopeptidase [Cellvibrio sp. PSBB006]|jgi:tetratricopeptide (TPR) repeat protein|uniref:tetratricopeptide repeat protein n=1 Tax=Cellvibrio sp. PSBB006 TaxID=1987723 RepID=UPI000B3BAAAC|nr:hypothetical protein [Cellvibrio sp. PSBB006]ARU29655.1 hypothetical protein CBR65_20650 [Cellvibrio sp. PSBB006]
MRKVMCQLFVVSVLSTVLGACQTSPKPAPKKPAPAAVVPEPRPAPKPVNTREQSIKRLLADAEYALSQNQLLMPLNDNAHDRYHAVLLMDPDNSEAKTGLQAITLRYLELARSAAARSRYAEAQGHLKNARDLDPKNPLVEEFAVILRKEIANQKPPAPYKPGPDERMIDARALSAKSPEVIAQLGELAQVARESGDLVMIHARNDAEGRWIYQQMRDAVPGFLLRGDIRITQQPRIKFVPRLQ